MYDQQCWLAAVVRAERHQPTLLWQLCKLSNCHTESRRSTRSTLLPARRREQNNQQSGMVVGCVWLHRNTAGRGCYELRLTVAPSKYCSRSLLDGEIKTINNQPLWLAVAVLRSTIYCFASSDHHVKVTSAVWDPMPRPTPTTRVFALVMHFISICLRRRRTDGDVPTMIMEFSTN